MKRSLIILLMCVWYASAYSQNCNGVSRTRIKNDTIDVYGGIVNSVDFYSLMIEKHVYKQAKKGYPKYELTMVAAAKAMLPDSLVEMTGNFTVKLGDGSEVTWEGATCFNDPLKNGLAIGFKIMLNEDQMKLIAAHGIAELGVYDNLIRTSFRQGKRKAQQKIADCLVQRYQR